ncbi:MAG: 4-hydroxy-tetrahydrodipicolinate synthase [Alicyclobacillus herbarius]|uniref:4-hydroxy-tetrahydrodipicolinate synthase n=1 Tax=Alicyclobacillus herbarius TaxID=122960 RepID=UPI0003FE3631|nr:4-hydroxy-tetrahydrodipicolinate synthase [Alicyclobacillus herbarius]MCL6632729.1 4-hydroxy-tetrahydrodipicolinate synthase [Alicyclobacillus herbarius]
MDFGRIVTAMATPFTADGALDVAGLERLINHLLETGTTCLLAAGTTGESPTLTHTEKLRLFESTLRFADGRVPVMAGTGTNDTRASIELSREAARLGVHGLLLVTPYYNKPSQEGLYHHFAAIAEAVDLPIMLYNVPGRTAVNIDVDTALRLAEVPNIVALKEASGNFAQILEIAARKPDDFLLYSGDDKFTLPMMAVGGYGVVSVASHVVGLEIQEMIHSFLAGDHRAAATWSGRLLPIFEALFRTTSPSPLKAALELLGLPSGGVRLPLVAAGDAVVEELRRELTRLGKLSDR